MNVAQYESIRKRDVFDLDTIVSILLCFSPFSRMWCVQRATRFDCIRMPTQNPFPKHWQNVLHRESYWTDTPTPSSHFHLRRALSHSGSDFDCFGMDFDLARKQQTRTHQKWNKTMFAVTRNETDAFDTKWQNQRWLAHGNAFSTRPTNDPIRAAQK